MSGVVDWFLRQEGCRLCERIDGWNWELWWWNHLVRFSDVPCAPDHQTDFEYSFVMPAVFDSLVHDSGLTPHNAWRVAFIVPFILIVVFALGMIFLCEDTPTGSWADRNNTVNQVRSNTTGDGKIVDVTGKFTDISVVLRTTSPSESSLEENIKGEKYNSAGEDHESAIQGEIIRQPTIQEAIRVVFSLQCFMLCATYACSFGGELAINSILGAYYLKNFPHLGQTNSGRWAAMFGLLNLICRPAGGAVADALYNRTKSVEAKKFWLVFCGCAQGAMCLAIGLTDPRSESLMFGLVAGLALFMDASNGANWAIVPHIHPSANGKSCYYQPPSQWIQKLTFRRRSLWRCRRSGKSRWHYIRDPFPL